MLVVTPNTTVFDRASCNLSRAVVRSSPQHAIFANIGSNVDETIVPLLIAESTTVSDESGALYSPTIPPVGRKPL